MTEIREDVYSIALAGLLHDIGKFAQRAGIGEGKHAEIGGEIVCHSVPGPWLKQLYPVIGHHDETLADHRTRVVALADRLSAGERTDTGQASPRQLLSIFCRVETDAATTPENRYWPLRPLELDEGTLFAASELTAAKADDAYKGLWSGFERELKVLKAAHDGQVDLPTYLESLQLLMLRYTWCVPSAFYYAVPDVSLYDHSRMTAALATCLLDVPDDHVKALLASLKSWYRAGPKAPPSEDLESTDTALLVGGDISGLQDFIYTVTARGATSALRGRSFYLQLLTEAIARRVLAALGLPQTNLIYQGGGNFYLLAPPDAASKLQDVQKEISRVLLEHHKGELYLALAWEPLKAVDFYGGRIAGKWDDLAQKQRHIKQRRFAELGSDIAAVFAPEGHGGDEQDGLCHVCGREHPKITVSDDVRKCEPCIHYEALGQDLRHAAYLTLTPNEHPQKETMVGSWETVLADLGLQATVTDSLPHASNRRRVVLALSDDALACITPNRHTAVGRRFLVNVTPIITADEIAGLQGKVADLPPAGRVKPFSAMAEQSQGIKRLGVLRMDLDNLGNIFAEGLGAHASLSRVAGLSFAISLFFEGWVGTIARDVEDKVNQAAQMTHRGNILYSIYSGGDDLFFVGSWDAVVPLAQRIRADLKRFTCDHPGIHASAGISLISGKYPLYQAAADAGDAESKAKGLRWSDAGGRPHTKDALAFLDVALPWHQFGYGDAPGADTVSALCALLIQEREQNMRHSVIRTLLSIYTAHREAAEERADKGEDLNQSGDEQILWGPWIWQGYYRLNREGDFGKRLAARLHDEERRFRDITWVGVAARWAEYLVR